MYSEGASSATTLYLMEGENIVRYRALLPNGNYTAAKTLIITVHNADPTFEVEFTPNRAGGLRMQLTDLSEDAKEALASPIAPCAWRLPSRIWRHPPTSSPLPWTATWAWT